MFGLLGISFVCLYLCFYNEHKRQIQNWMEAVSVWCVLLFFKTEIMSLFGKVNAVSSLLFWCMISISAIVWITCQGKWHSIIDVIRIICANRFSLLLGGVMFVLAILTVPYNWDSMTYHMPRIVCWSQNQSVAHYATNTIRQVASPPFHEFICLDLYILSGKTDVLFNLVQCSAFLTNAWLVYEIAYKLGGRKKFCSIGTLIFCSMPIAFGEAVTTQNDNLACMFLLIFIWYLIDLLDINQKIEMNKTTSCNVVIMSVCIGLGYLTKPTVSIGMAVSAVILLICCFMRKDSFVKLIKLLLLSTAMILLLLIPEIARNLQTFGTVFPAMTGPRQLVGTLEPRYLLINFLKNFLYNFPTNDIINSEGILSSWVYRIAALIKVDINALSISEDGREFYLAGENMGHDTAVNVVVMYLSTLVLVWCIYRGKKIEKKKRIYICIAVLLYIVICTCIRWEPFVSRYQLPYLALLCPMIAIGIEDIYDNATHTTIGKCCVPVACWIGIMGLITLFSYHGSIVSKQGMSRPDGYFTNRGEIQEEYRQVCETVKGAGVKLIGLKTGEDSYEYPIYYMLKDSVIQIHNIMVSNETGKYEDADFMPECILSTDDLGDQTEYHGSLYSKLMEGSLKVYMKE